ncbi:MAG TPA: bifunctional diaminohydroxyphosphoribosylaminopyrimidine deaminase/5-amino-6-(5-phosphoribosylamino)uracil reductase RibD, partial [Synergistetes bacterium]|nr:bifunctional diaminohydroxyphosphoribosylaminopyrimidine deaminase/5-amino-6-(5-phosphoribosylamino)uracil reductase RibD [Synergistota bacterium]
TNPNPLVGSVIVDESGICGWGFHSAPGFPHAEVEALSMAGQRAAGGTLYVNLEPCSHFGKTPPCAPRIIGAGIRRVVAGIRDPDPRVSGQGFKILASAGLVVTEGVLEKECRRINRGFLSRLERNRPWVTLKAAMTIDGTMALGSGESKWISNERSRDRAHLLRVCNDAVLVGIGTVEYDDPLLTVRHVTGRDPRTVVLDPGLRMSPMARLARNGTLVFGLTGAVSEKVKALEGKGCRVFLVENDEKGRIPLISVMETLAGEGINNLLVEGGPVVAGSFLQTGCFDSISLFVSPRIAGEGRKLGEGFKIPGFEKSAGLIITSVVDVEGDLWIEGEKNCSRD